MTRNSKLETRNCAVFLDRDGTINVDRGWTWRLEQLKLLPGATKAIRRLNEARFKVIVITNQSGIGRGRYTEQDVEQFHAAMNSELAKYGAHIDAFYSCPHHPTKATGKYLMACRCRKPEPGMLKQAMRDFGIDAHGSFMIGDAPKDVKAGRRAGLATIRLTAKADRSGSDHVAPDLLRAAELILKLRRRS